MSNSFKLCPTHFSRGEKTFAGGFAPLRPHGYGPGYTIELVEQN